MTISRRTFCAGVIAGSGLRAMPAAVEGHLPPQAAVAATGSHIGNLYPFVQAQADKSPLELSFLRPEFKDLRRWQTRARSRIFDHLFYAPPRVAPQAQVVRRRDMGDYVEEYLTFQTSPDVRVPAYVLVPKKAERPAPGIVALHSHDGLYLWGKEKVIGAEQEHPYLTTFKQQRYGGKSIGAELARQGYVVIAIDMFYWGERRMLLDDDPPAYRERPLTMTDKEIQAFNQRSSQNESLVGRSLFTAGTTWPGIVLWDDIRTLDYLASRPEVDAKRLGCVGLSVGGYRSFLLAALDERIKSGGRRRVDDLLRLADQAARGQHHRPVLSHQRAVPIHGPARHVGAHRAAIDHGHQRIAGSSLRTRWRQRRVRQDRALLRQGRRSRPPALPPVQRAARIQSRHAIRRRGSGSEGGSDSSLRRRSSSGGSGLGERLRPERGAKPPSESAGVGPERTG